MRKLALLLLCTTITGCGGGVMTLSSVDNDPAALGRALATEHKPTLGRPLNASGKPMAFLVTSVPTDARPQLIAWDLQAARAVWTLDTDVKSRIIVGATMVALREGDAIVGRGLGDGHLLWTYPIPAQTKLAGLAADGDRFYAVLADDQWHLVAISAKGSELWRTSATGALGTPAARGGLVYVPFLTQWLGIVNGLTGRQLTRVRQSDEAINYVRALPEGIFYGSKGVIALDDKSVTGTREGVHYGAAVLPNFVKTFDYYFDGFNPTQVGYSALDRNRILWRATATPDGLVFQDGLAVVYTYRFFFGFDAAGGQLRWAQQHPHNDIVSAEDGGHVIAYVSVDGEIGAIDRKTGSFLGETKVGARILGATFDADGWQPTGAGQGATTPEVLAAIAGDRDARFTSVKVFAAAALGDQPGPEVTTALLKILHDDSIPREVAHRAGEVLIARKDEASVNVLIQALAEHTDFIAGTTPRAVDVVARALGAIHAAAAVPALIAHLEDPSTPLGTVPALVQALVATGEHDLTIPALRAHLMMYRCDPMFAVDHTGPAALNAVIDALMTPALGGPAERELVVFVAHDPRTTGAVAEHARQVVGE